MNQAWLQFAADKDGSLGALQEDADYLGVSRRLPGQHPMRPKHGSSWTCGAKCLPGSAHNSSSSFPGPHRFQWTWRVRDCSSRLISASVFMGRPLPSGWRQAAWRRVAA